jgi:hypothetical protein
MFVEVSNKIKFGFVVVFVGKNYQFKFLLQTTNSLLEILLHGGQG